MNLGTRMTDVEAKVSSLDGQRSPVKSFATTGKNAASTRDPEDSEGEIILPMIDSFKKSREGPWWQNGNTRTSHL